MSRPKRRAPTPPPLDRALCQIVADLLLGGRHNRNTVARTTGRSLPSADRWLKSIEELIPGARRVKVGKTAWIEIPQPEPWKAKKRLGRVRPMDWLDKLRPGELEHIEYMENGGKRDDAVRHPRRRRAS